MFDKYSFDLLRTDLDLPGLNQESTARALSGVFFTTRLGPDQSELDPEVGQQANQSDYLKRLPGTLLFGSVLREGAQLEERTSAAFTMAEAIGLELEKSLRHQGEASTRSEEELSPIRVEAALLYLIAGFDACAARVAREIPAPLLQRGLSLKGARAECFHEVRQLCIHESPDGPHRRAEATNLDPAETNLASLHEDTLALAYLELRGILREFRRWLVGEAETQIGILLERLDRMIAAFSPSGRIIESPEWGCLLYFSRLCRDALSSTSRRSLVHSVEPPQQADEAQYASYLMARARGRASRGGRPLLWPSAARFIEAWQAGSGHNAVVAMPTGSGKSFLAEIAISQAVQSGWALYLAPTNALTSQIRQDLSSALRSLGTRVRAFLGSHEYSAFPEEGIDTMDTNSVAVMTPEKCALAMRLSPHLFENCTLVVFDECHLIADHSSMRGASAELTLTELMVRTDSCRFLLMSALVQNPDELAEWISRTRNERCEAISLNWRPTRAIRAALGVDSHDYSTSSRDARNRLRTLPARRVSEKFEAKAVLAANLLGPWSDSNDSNYSLLPIDLRCKFKVNGRVRSSGRRGPYTDQPEQWVNGNAIQVSQHLVQEGIQTLTFTPKNKHYPFHNARNTTLSPDSLERRSDQPGGLRSLQTLAEDELGVQSEVFALIAQGISTHTSLMLPAEKAASEFSFKNGHTPLMYATGTLAQGLNLPAVAVVIAGTTIGDPRGISSEEQEQRRLANFLNAAGRAGRAGFANQGIVIGIPDSPIAFGTPHAINNARESLEYFKHADAAIEVKSGLADFIGRVQSAEAGSETASPLELRLIAHLTGMQGQPGNPEEILKKTLASYTRSRDLEENLTDQMIADFMQLAEDFLSSTGAPSWLPGASQKAGIDFFLCLDIYRASQLEALEFAGPRAPQTTQEWASLLIRCLSLTRPENTLRFMSASDLRLLSPEFDALGRGIEDGHGIERLSNHDWQSAWLSTIPVLHAWLSAEPISRIASLQLGLPIEDIEPDRRGGKPLPKAIALCSRAFGALSVLAGGFLAIAEEVATEETPLELACLPACIRHGLDSPGSLAWYRHGILMRKPASRLNSMFPVPEGITDSESRRWIRTRRDSWLEEDPEEDQVLASIQELMNLGLAF